jgi:hypothetical protein
MNINRAAHVEQHAQKQQGYGTNENEKIIERLRNMQGIDTASSGSSRAHPASLSGGGAGQSTIERQTQLFVSNRDTEEFIAPITITVPAALYDHVPDRLVITKYTREITPPGLLFGDSGKIAGTGTVELTCSAPDNSEEAFHFRELVDWMSGREKAVCIIRGFSNKS